MKNVLLSWSSGKDSAWALHVLRHDPSVRIVGLLTTINQQAHRVAMHAVRESLLAAQASALGLPLTKVYIPDPCSNADYERAMTKAIHDARRRDVDAIAFGDIFLADIRRYREEKLAPTGIEPIFPLWGAKTADLAREMVAAGLRAIVTSVDLKQLDSAFAGRVFDQNFLHDLPDDADPCGENGEFHSFAYAGPMFDPPLTVALGETLERDGFVFLDVIPSV